jgi:hypothetical protein
MAAQRAEYADGNRYIDRHRQQRDEICRLSEEFDRSEGLPERRCGLPFRRTDSRNPKRPDAELWAVPIFKRGCTVCHGADASGNTPMGKKNKIPDFHSAAVQSQSDADLIWAGMVAVVQTFGSKINFHPHVHAIARHRQPRRVKRRRRK